MKYHIKSPEEMLELWKKFAKQHKRMLLHWELWAGKTLLTKWYAQWMGIDENKVQSPTYAYINIYDEKILHIDMYRIETHEELVEKWIMDQISQYEYIVIEWPKYEQDFPTDWFVTIKIEKISENERMVEVIEL